LVTYASNCEEDEELKEWFQSHSLNVIEGDGGRLIEQMSPIGTLVVDNNTKYGYLREGTSRLLIAQKRGVKFFPVLLRNEVLKTNEMLQPISSLLFWKIVNVNRFDVTLQLLASDTHQIIEIDDSIDLKDFGEIFGVNYWLSSWDIVDLLHCLGMVTHKNLCS